MLLDSVLLGATDCASLLGVGATDDVGAVADIVAAGVGGDDGWALGLLVGVCDGASVLDGALLGASLLDGALLGASLLDGADVVSLLGGALLGATDGASLLGVGAADDMGAVVGVADGCRDIGVGVGVTESLGAASLGSAALLLAAPRIVMDESVMFKTPAIDITKASRAFINENFSRSMPCNVSDTLKANGAF